jgi:hypothetical protein
VSRESPTFPLLCELPQNIVILSEVAAATEPKDLLLLFL